MIGLEALPLEVLNLVFRGDVAALQSASQVCVAWRNLLRAPLLWCEPVFSGIVLSNSQLTKFLSRREGPGVSALKSLDVCGCPQISVGGVLKALKHSHLERLDIRGIRSTSKAEFNGLRARTKSLEPSSFLVCTNWYTEEMKRREAEGDEREQQCKRICSQEDVEMTRVTCSTCTRSVHCERCRSFRTKEKFPCEHVCSGCGAVKEDDSDDDGGDDDDAHQWQQCFQCSRSICDECSASCQFCYAAFCQCSKDSCDEQLRICATVHGCDAGMVCTDKDCEEKGGFIVCDNKDCKNVFCEYHAFDQHGRAGMKYCERSECRRMFCAPVYSYAECSEEFLELVDPPPHWPETEDFLEYDDKKKMCVCRDAAACGGGPR